MVSLGGLAGWLAARRGFLSFPSFVGWFTWIGRSAPSLLGSITPSGREHSQPRKARFWSTFWTCGAGRGPQGPSRSRCLARSHRYVCSGDWRWYQQECLVGGETGGEMVRRRLCCCCCLALGTVNLDLGGVKPLNKTTTAVL